MAMKATGLMIGDWVNYSILNLNAKVFSILGNHTIGIKFVDKNNKVEAIHGLIEETINPIPLTEEILMKNGFSYEHEEETCSTCSYHHWQLVGEYLALDDCQYWRKEKKDDLPRFRISGIDVNYVHQLQHLLRLCGVEKELTI